MTVWQLYLYNVSSHVREALLSTLIPALWKWSIAVLWSVLRRRRRICNFIETLFVSFLFFLQLRDTKSIGQDTTLLHFLASKCEENYEAMLRFPEELEHVENASKGRMPSSRKPHCKPVHFTQYAPHVSSLLRRWFYALHLCPSTFCLCAPPPHAPRLPLPLWQDCKGPASLSFGLSIN